MTRSLKDIAEALVAHCREGTEAEGLRTLYHPDAVSVEAAAMPGADGREASGLDAIRAKHDWWASAMEVHSASTSEPFLHGEDRFALIFEVDATERASGQRRQMREVAVYTVADGQIVREEFFYAV